MDVEIDLDRELLAIETGNLVHCQITVKAPQVERSSDRKPLNLAIALDRSGSMSGEKLRHAIDAVCLLIDQLTGDDIVSLVAFDSDVSVVLPAAARRDKAEAKALVRKIATSGSTNLSGGWFAAVGEVRRNLAKDRISRVLLLTDGQANLGVTDPGALIDQAHRFVDDGVDLSTLGYGADFNEDLLRKLADAGHGHFFYIATPDDAPAAFKQELGELLSMVAQNVRVAVNVTPVVESVVLLNDLPTIARENGWEVDLGGLSADEQKILVVRLGVRPVRRPGRTRLGELKLEYDWILGEIRHDSHMYPIEATHVDGVRAVGERPRLRVVENVVRMSSVQARKAAIAKADVGDFAGAGATLREFRDKYANLQDESRAIRDELDRLDVEAKDLSEKSHYKEARKRTVVMSYSLSSTMGLGNPRPPGDTGPPKGKPDPSE